MGQWSWVILVLCTQIGGQLFKPQNYARGKYLTMPLRKRFAPKLAPVWFRVLQIYATVALYYAVSPFWKPFFYVYCIILIAYVIDDWFSDHDRKKFWAEVRNKIKWKMELPKPVHAGKAAS